MDANELCAAEQSQRPQEPNIKGDFMMTGIGTSFGTCDAEPSRSTHGDEDRIQVGRGENQRANDEPKLPKGYRHIRSAIEAVLECSHELVSGPPHSRIQRRLFLFRGGAE
jgi:hypothetical protein